MAPAKDGDTVKVHYKGTLADGSSFDSSEGRDPLEFVLGQPGIIPGFQEIVRGMGPGEKKKGTIPAAQAYGEHRKELVLDVPKSKLPEGLKVEVGQSLTMTQSDGSQIMFLVVASSDDQIKIDANPPLAGKDLTFEITLVAIG